MTVTQARSRIWYRLLESSLALTSIGFILIIFLFSFSPSLISWVSIFMILYGLFWAFKVALITIYTLYTYKQMHRWQGFDWAELFEKLNNEDPKAYEKLDTLALKYPNKLDWYEKRQLEIQAIKESKTKPNEIYHTCIFTIVNEPIQVIQRSLEHIYQANYDKSKLIVLVSQEEGAGVENNLKLRQKIAKLDWIKIWTLPDYKVQDLYQEHTSEYLQSLKLKKIAKLKFSKQKLNLFFTQHPKNLVGEIRGKASNEDWAARNLSFFLHQNQISDKNVITTSLDSDSHVGEDFFNNLSYRFLASKDRLDSGFQPVHVYSNNFFQTGFWQRQIATQTTLDNMSKLAIHGEAPFFAIYSLSLNLLRRADFWERELIAEDIILTVRCIRATQGRFHLQSHYGILEGDAVEDVDYIDAIISQYKQLQRWSWGGVELVPYMFKMFFVEPRDFVDVRVKLRWIFLQYINHFFWATTPIMFSLGMIFPEIIGSNDYNSTQLAENLATFGQYFAWLSVFFISIFIVVAFRFITKSASKHTVINWYSWYLIGFQIIFSPMLFIFMGLPALDAQIRGLFGKYLSYVVTPKQ